MECWSADPTKRPTMGDVVYWLGRATPNRKAFLSDGTSVRCREGLLITDEMGRRSKVI